MKPVLAVDFDDVIADFNGHFIPFMNVRIETTVTYETHYSFHFFDVYGLTYEEMEPHLETFCHDYKLHGTMRPIPGIRDALQRLARHYRIIVVTSRCESLRWITEVWLYAHGFTMIEAVHFANSQSRQFAEQRRCKSEICRQLDAIALIEDALHNAVAVTHAGTPVLVPDRPWNQYYLPAGARRFWHPEQIETLLE